jgi:hypothetical protein
VKARVHVCGGVRVAFSSIHKSRVARSKMLKANPETAAANTEEQETKMLM